ncbi:MAG: hypothetical protein MUE40_20265 [Anaerolineae bacterium]|nr:hypothetical protein [Anaerolineae bacterium]
MSLMQSSLYDPIHITQLTNDLSPGDVEAMFSATRALLHERGCALLYWIIETSPAHAAEAGLKALCQAAGRLEPGTFTDARVHVILVGKDTAFLQFYRDLLQKSSHPYVPVFERLEQAVAFARFVARLAA